MIWELRVATHEKNPGVITDSFGDPLVLGAAASKESQEHVRGSPPLALRKQHVLSLYSTLVCPHPQCGTQYLAPPAFPRGRIRSLTERSQKIFVRVDVLLLLSSDTAHAKGL